MAKPLVNSWTEFGELEYVCIGNAVNCHYPNWDPFYKYNYFEDDRLHEYLCQPLGPKPQERIKNAQDELAYLAEIIKGEEITVATISELDEDIKQELKRNRSYTTHLPNQTEEDRRIKKKTIEICSAPTSQFDHLLVTPWFKNYYQFGVACPRDVVITMGNTILEAPTSSRCRYFESNYYRDMIYPLWSADPRIHWKAAPQPTCGDSLYDMKKRQDICTTNQTFASSGYKTPLNDSQVAFDAADMMRLGRDILYKRSCGANNKGIDWLRREFSEFRFHMFHFPDDCSPHIDDNIVPIRPPTAGSEGVVLINQTCPPLASELALFTNNDWKPYWCPMPAVDKLPPVPICSASLNLNLFSLSPKCCIIEECEVPLYDFLDDLGLDVITVPLRGLNEFGGGVHCSTWDIRRNDTLKDYFPNQDYEKELKIDLNNFYDDYRYPKSHLEGKSANEWPNYCSI